MQASYLIIGTVLPAIIADFWYNGKCLIWIMKISFLVYLIMFGMLPFIFRYSYQLQKRMIFLNFISWPIGMDFSKPESVGLVGTRNFYIITDEKVKIGAWQILPKSLVNSNIPNTAEAYEAELRKSKRPVFLYMHGNSGNRASGHRVELYQLLQKLDYHVICFDYRTYGDSDQVDLSEEGVVRDSAYVLEWLMKIVDSSTPIFVWGHSLGTGVSTHAMARVAKDRRPTALFLESPFNNMADEITEHPFSRMFRHLPWFHWVIVDPLWVNHIRFQSDKHIEKIIKKCPVMILHAEDDNVVPFSLGEKLYTTAKLVSGSDVHEIQMTKIDASFGLGHKYICRYKDLPQIIQNFVDTSPRI